MPLNRPFTVLSYFTNAQPLLKKIINSNANFDISLSLPQMWTGVQGGLLRGPKEPLPAQPLPGRGPVSDHQRGIPLPLPPSQGRGQVPECEEGRLSEEPLFKWGSVPEHTERPIHLFLQTRVRKPFYSINIFYLIQFKNLFR